MKLPVTPTLVPNVGQVVSPGTRSILKGQRAASGERELVLHSRPGVSFGIESSANTADPSVWMPWQQATLTNLLNVSPIGITCVMAN